VIRRSRALVALGLVAIACHGAPATRSPADRLAAARARFTSRGLAGVTVALVPRDRHDPHGAFDEIVVASGDDPDRRTLPASTFKIVNTLIGLQTRAIGPEHRFRWDGKPRRLRDWDRDLSLVEAFKVSCVPCYQEVARAVGQGRMREQVARIDYGNAEVGTTVDTFWLEGPIAISPREQAALIRGLFLEVLPFERAHQQRVKALMAEPAGPGYRLAGKTGWAIRVGPHLGWYVGFSESAVGPTYFATRVQLPASRSSEMLAVRKAITVEILRDLGRIP
jgi:beta-lactamase class D